jgi:GTP cyclohydrolase II
MVGHRTPEPEPELNSMPQSTAPAFTTAVPHSGVNAVSRVVGELRRGMPIVLKGNGKALLVAAAEGGTDPATMSRLSGHAVSCLVTAQRAIALGLDPVNAQTVSILPAAGLTEESVSAITGNAPDGARPMVAMSGPAQPLQEAAIELMKFARLLPAALTVPVTTDPADFAHRNDFLSVDADDVEGYRLAATVLVQSDIAAEIPLEGAEKTKFIAFRPADGGKPHIAIVIGDPDPATPVLTRLHSECYTGDLLGSLRCDCGDQLRGAVAAIAEDGGGVLLYMAQEGRGIGLANKLRAYRLQDFGFDTIDANEELGFGADERVYAPAASMLHRLGISRIRLMTNNPAKVSALAEHGIEVVDRITHAFPANGHNERYLMTKATRSGHMF